ncbi:haloacid dehalogenase-like hydrolase [Pikeienuella piscinae]|uniref:Haloacid dehalogenase-like hydrolase n=1 Tax=Pikeienuella piscinae TaxID=2748098 RepID=A0A7L5BUN8_9RHOB|nr:HAD family hydrolase [Pikeienuella piscinae]QIE55555.1 haloacid dehalogenase-like hydrolase [Pikeienuella piscinae]
MRALLASMAIATLAVPALADPLPSWTDGDAKSRIIEFVEAVTTQGGDDYVIADDRIAVFDNDGTLWAEQPVYFQALYALDRLKEKAKADPSILTSDTLKAAAAGDMKGAMAGGEKGLLEILDVSHSGSSVEDFKADVRDWLANTRHPTTGRAYTDMTYQPMLELLTYLRDEGFSTYIVSGGGIRFIRAFAEKAYGIPPQQVVGSAGKLSYKVVDGNPAVMMDGQIAFVDDKEGKPVGIDTHIGKRPIFAAGNSDGDFQMLEYTMAGDGPRFGMLVHHTDADREFAYDRKGHVGVLSKGLDEAEQRGWLLVDMAKDWRRVWSSAE